MAGRIFINYRRGSLKDAQLLATLIEKSLLDAEVFFDLDATAIQPGERWRRALERQVAQSDVMIALISPNWMDLEDERGSRRLDRPDDFVRFEIAQALRRKIPVLPVLVDGATMPRAGQLPENIMELARSQALPLRSETVTQDSAAIATHLKAVLEKRRPTPTTADLDLPTAAPGVLALDALRDPKVRERMSPAAVRLFMRLSDVWRLAVDQRRALLGDISTAAYDSWRDGKTGTLTRDELERISLVLGIHKGLRLLFADEASATRWFTSPNRDLPFGGDSPLGRALRGSIDDLYAVRRYIDSWRGMK